jgi:type I restriction enzyme S subunit
VWIAEFDGCSSVDQFAFDVNQELADTAFLASFMRSETFLRRAAGSTTTGQLPRISIDEILAVECELPPITQQKEIAADLAFKSSAVQAANHAARERLVAAETLASAFYREAFGEAVPFTASPIVPSEPVCVGWSWHRLTDVARLATGHTPSRRCPEYWDGDIPWIQLPDIRALDGKIALDTSEHTNEAGIANSAAVLLPKDTVCMSRTASVGFVTMMGKPMATSQDFVNWVCGPDLDAAFLMHLLIRCRSAIRELGSGAVHHTIYFPTVESFAVCIPPVIEQRRIVELLTANLHKSFDLASRCREELAAIEALPASLLRTVFERNGVDG